MKKKYCIFHIPYEIEGNLNSGSKVRPMRMIEAFENIGYEVDIVMGYGKDRKKQIKNIKENIKTGKKYDFLYSENSNLPTLLTEKSHIPFYPLLDFKFFIFCKKHNIRIGLFYRDVHWRFEHFRKEKNKCKLMIGDIFYKYDLKKYAKILDVLYIPSAKMLEYIPIQFNKKIEELPPGGYIVGKQNTLEKSDNTLNIFYVGGFGGLYNLELLFQAVGILDFINLTICCRENAWNVEKKIYEKYLNDRIKIVHEQEEGLKKYYDKADVLNLFLEPTEYWEIAIPIKLFEYLSYNKPILAVKNTAVGNFVKDKDIGWDCEYSLDKLVELLSSIYRYKSSGNDIVLRKKDNIRKILKYNTWESRARKVSKDLS